MIAFALFLYWIFGSQGDATENNDDHDKSIETGNCHDPVNKYPYPAKKNKR